MAEQTIEELPPGTIIRRIIRGKERFYHQWREDGKTRSRYLKSHEVLPLREKIEKRKALIKETRNAKRETLNLVPRFACGVLTGKRLSELAASVRPLKARGLLKPIVAYLQAPSSGHLLSVEGLPQTGKTTLLRQAIRALSPDELKTCAYLSIPYDLTVRDFLADLHTLSDQGINRILIDGFDRASALRKTCSVLEDTFAAIGLRIVLTVTVPNDIILPVRSQRISTTYLPLSDFLAEAKDATHADYLERGGPTEAQLETRALYAADALNRRDLLRVLSDAVHRRSFGSARLGNDIQKLMRCLEESLGEAPSASDLAYLRALGIVATAEDETFFILPGLRHALSTRLVRELLTDNVAAHLGAAERKIVEETILGLVANRTLADLVLYTMMQTRKRETTDVFRVRFPSGGFDVVVADREELTCELYEVCNTDERNDRQLANMTNPDMLDTIEHRYGTIISRTLVYNGRNAWHTSGIAYRNAVTFL